jgi:hypothetical protein
MLIRRAACAVLFAMVLPVAVAWVGAAVSREQADTFASKVDAIARNGGPGRSLPRRTPVSESEVNSWFVYRAQPHLPQGVTAPKITLAGPGRLTGEAIVDLDVIAKRRASGGMLDPWGYVSGKVPVTVEGTLRTRNGLGQFDMEAAAVSGVPIPKMLLQEMLSYYSRTPELPEGIRLDDSFALPANIRQIDVVEGQAVVVQ